MNTLVIMQEKAYQIYFWQCLWEVLFYFFTNDTLFERELGEYYIVAIDMQYHSDEYHSDVHCRKSMKPLRPIQYSDEEEEEEQEGGEQFYKQNSTSIR